MIGERLHTDWQELMAGLGADERSAQAMFIDLCRRYSEPGRFYHTIDHVAHVLAEIERASQTFSDVDLVRVRLAAWFHDVFYDTRAQDNEEKSADYTGEALRQMAVGEATVAAVQALILATKTHLAEDDNCACQLLLDADLSILGADEAGYRVYQEAIRKEYAWVPKDQYRVGRSRVLGTFLQRPRLFLTPPFETLEEQARRNLNDERRQWQS